MDELLQRLALYAFEDFAKLILPDLMNPAQLMILRQTHKVRSIVGDGKMDRGTGALRSKSADRQPRPNNILVLFTQT
jgi:hypothetical protein